ncbi:MAG: sulfatase-like hydrolase/transferase [Anaerolineae bacterium]|nr:sulfatase-like hydrolase/transferase [Anaerolineae bacterium]
MSEKPNIIFIITDHQAFYGHDREGGFEYKWPNFEAFCQQGIRFDRAYSVAPICSPARSSMMTGLYPSAHGMKWNTENRASQNLQDLRPGTLLYSHYLAEAGYRNAYVGKWHCGATRLPIDYGIEGWSLPDYGKIYMSDAYKEYAAKHGLDNARARIEHNLNHPEWDGQTLVLHDPSPWRFMNGSGVLEGPPEAHEEFFVAHLAVEKLKELARGSQPWSLVVSFWGPHQPYYPTEPYASMVDPKSIPEYPSFRDNLQGRPLRHLIHREMSHRSAAAWPEWATWQEILARCYGQGLQNDAAIGQVLQALDDTGLADNTLVIWLSDHGDAVASHGGLWDKSATFIEEVARVPLAIRWPRRIAAGQRTEKLVSNMDATATLLDAAGVPVPPKMHSRSLLPICRDPKAASWPDHLICEHHGHVTMVYQKMVLFDRYKYVAALFDGDELYDLAADPFEMNNRIDDPGLTGLRGELRQRVITHLEASSEKNWDSNSLLLSLKSGRY